MGPFMAVIEKTDVLDVRSFCEMHCIFTRISVQSAQSVEKRPVFSYNRKKSLANRGKWCYDTLCQQGSLRKQAESGMYCPDP